MSAEILSAAKLVTSRVPSFWNVPPSGGSDRRRLKNATVPLFRKTALLLIVSEFPNPMLLKSMLVLFTKSAAMVWLPVAAKSTAEPPSMINVPELPSTELNPQPKVAPDATDDPAVS